VSGDEAISPTAHYTGHVWVRAGISHPELATAQGKALYELMAPANALSRAMGGPTLESYLLARHRAIDALLTTAIEEGAVTQVLEIAAGLSPRGWRFVSRYGAGLTYVEADLPGMAGRKRRALDRMGSLGPGHRVAELDALRPGSFDDVAGELDPEGGLAVITEGLLGYLSTPDVLGLWARIASAVKNFDGGRYFSDLHLGGVQTPAVRAFRVALSAFVRGRVQLHFEDAQAAREALLDAGFASAHVRRATELIGGIPPRDHGADLVRIIEASTT